MGCLFFPFELIFDGIIDGYFALMQWIVPNNAFSKAFRTAIKILAGVFTSVLFLSMLFSIILIFNDDEYIRHIGRLMFFIPLGISVVQIIIGIIVRHISNRKK